MKKPVKKALKITGITLGSLLVLLLVLPFFFKGKILNIAKTEINKSINATVNFDDLSLSLIKNFPNVSVTLDEISVVGKEEFAKDTLAYVSKINVVVDIMSIFGDEGYKINKVLVKEPRITLIKLESGKSNMDITFPDSTEVEDTTETQFKLSLKKLEIKNANILYRDDSTRSFAKVENFNFLLSGNMTQDQTTLKLLSTIDSISYADAGSLLLKKAQVRLKSDIDADLKNSKYTLGKTEFQLNKILLNLDGWVALPDSSTIDMDIKISAPEVQFKDLLSLIPALYMKDFETIKTEGKLALSAFAKGKMKGEEYPAFGLDLKVSDASFRYPALPKAVTNIQILLNVASQGGILDNTVINLSKFHFQMAENPFDLSALVKTPISDPDINVNAKGTLNLSAVKDFYPLEEELTGLLKADVSLQGRLSSVEKEQYQDFKALGFLNLQNIKYKSEDFPHPLNIAFANLEFTSQYLSLSSFAMKTGQSDVTASGKIQNYLGYVFKDETIKGQLNVQSNYFTLSDIMSSATEPETAPATASAEPSVIDVPGNVDFNLTAAFAKLIYDNIELNNIKGNIEVKEKKLNLKGLSLNTLGSNVNVSGYYSSADLTKPMADLNLSVKDLDIPSAFKTFNTIKQLMPIAEHAVGKVSLQMQLNTELDKTLSPVLQSIQAKGGLQTGSIGLSNVEALKKIAEAAKLNKLKSMTLNNVNVKFEVKDGRVSTQPFDIKVDKITSSVSGSMGLDQSLDYVMKMNVPRAELGSDANNFVNSLTGKANVQLPENIKFDILIGGTVSSPKIKVGASDMKNEMKDIAKAKIEEGKAMVNEQLDKAIAEAQKQKERLVAEAQKQANNIINQANAAGQRLMDEADKQAQDLVNKASNPLAKVAAKKAAEELKKEAQKKIDKANAEATNQANNLVKQAEQQGDKLIDEAKKKKL